MKFESFLHFQSPFHSTFFNCILYVWLSLEVPEKLRETCSYISFEQEFATRTLIGERVNCQQQDYAKLDIDLHLTKFDTWPGEHFLDFLSNNCKTTTLFGDRF